jgi:hypothetical protein
MKCIELHQYNVKAALVVAACAAALGIGTLASAQGYTPGYAPPPRYVPAPTYAPPPTVYPPPQVVVTPSTPVYSAVPQLDDQQLGDLTASIALYPDPLLAAMLPAATNPSEVASANQWLSRHSTPDELSIQQLPYQPAVKTLLHYPSVLQMMADHIDWTQALGSAFVYQQSDLMNSVQRWRATAQADGALFSTPQQDVVVTGGVIQILPAAPETVYVPVYDPAVVYVRGRNPRDAIHFNVGGRFGGWLDFDLDWHDHQVRVPSRPWFERHDNDARRRWEEIRRPIVIVPDRGHGDRRDDDRNRGDDRHAFVPDRNVHITFPDRVVTPDKDHKVITFGRGQGRGRDNNARNDGGRDNNGRNQGRNDNSRGDNRQGHGADNDRNDH